MNAPRTGTCDAARAMELFLSKLCEGTAAVATGGHARTATPSHM